MASMSNWLDLGLSADQEQVVRRGAELYKAIYLDTIDNVFEIAKAIEVLRTANYGTGVQGGFAHSLVQYGFTNRNGEPMDKGIRSNFKTLLDHEDEVRDWWKSVPERRKRDWLSGRAIFKHWQADKKPRKTPEQIAAEKAAKQAAYRAKMAPLAEPQDWVPQPKPTVEAMEAKQRAEAEAEAARLADAETAPSPFEELRARGLELEEELANVRERPAEPSAPESPIDAAAAITRLLADKTYSTAGYFAERLLLNEPNFNADIIGELANWLGEVADQMRAIPDEPKLEEKPEPAPEPTTKAKTKRSKPRRRLK